MKKILPASLVLAFSVSGVAQAQLQHAREYQRMYHAVAKKFGKRAPGCNLLSSCHGKATDGALVTSMGVLQRMLIPSPALAATPAYSGAVTPNTYSAGGGYANVPGVPASFAACVALRESTNGAGSSNIYGIQGPGGTGSLAQQKQAFAQMYAASGTQPWAPYDGC